MIRIFTVKLDHILLSFALLAAYGFSATSCVDIDPKDLDVTTIPTIVIAETPTLAYGGTLRLASREAPSHFDIHFDGSPALSTWGPGLVYGRLLRFTTSPGLRLPSLAVECELCRRWVMHDDRTFLFELRNGVQWHDRSLVGERSLNAEDFVFSYERQNTPGAPNMGLLASVNSVVAETELSVRFELAAPDADFMIGLADARSKIVAAEAVKVNGNLRSDPVVGVGSWKLANNTDFVFRFERHEAYFEDGLPYAELLDINVIPNQFNRNAAFRVGQLDIVDIEPSQWEEILNDFPDAGSLFVRETGTGMELSINVANASFYDPAVRRAVLQAHDPWHAIKEVWLDAAYMSPGFPVIDSSWLLGREELGTMFNNPDLARATVGDRHIKAVITVANFGQKYLDHASFLAEELRDVGFDSDIEVVNQKQFAEIAQIGGEYQILLGPAAPITTPNGFLFNVLHSAGNWNTHGLTDPEIDLLIQRQAAEYDPAIRRVLVLEIQRRVLDQAVRYMLATSVSIWVWQPNVRGFHPNFAGFEHFHWSKVWFEGS